MNRITNALAHMKGDVGVRMVDENTGRELALVTVDELRRGEARAATDGEIRSRTTINWLVALVKDAYVEGWRYGQSDVDRDDGWLRSRANVESQRLMRGE